MKFGKLAAGFAAVSLIAAPVAAQAAPAVERIAATSSSSEQLEGENGILIALLAAAAVIAGIIIIAGRCSPRFFLCSGVRGSNSEYVVNHLFISFAALHIAGVDSEQCNQRLVL